MKKVLGLLLSVLSILGMEAQTSYSLSEASKVDAFGRPLHKGASVVLKGVVHSQNFAATGGGPGGGGFFFSLADDTAGIIVSRGTTGGGGGGGGKNRMPNLYEGVLVYGKISSYTIRTGGGGGGGKTDSTGMVVILSDSIIQISAANTLKSGNLIASLSEVHDGDINILDSMVMKNSKDWKSNTSTTVNPGFAVFTIHKNGNVNDSLTLRVQNAVITSMPAPGGIFNVRGLQLQYDKTAPFFSSYQLAPRDSGDFIQLTRKTIPTYTISQAKHTNTTTGFEDSNGVYCILKGIVQSTSFVNNTFHFSMYDATGSIQVYYPTGNFGYAPIEGDSIWVKGSITQITTVTGGPGGGTQTTGWTAISPVDIMILNKNHTVHSPLVVTRLTEAKESELITLKKVKLIDATKWDTSATVFGTFRIPKTSFTTLVTNDIDTFTIGIFNTDSSAWYKPKPLAYFNITGIEGQRDRTAPLNGSYYIIARKYQDIVELSYGLPTKLIADVKNNDANGINQSAKTSVKCYLKGVCYSTNIGGKNKLFSMEDKSGAISVYLAPTISASIPNIGDSIKVKGTIVQFNGLSMISADSVGVISSKNTLNAPNKISYVAEVDESYHRMFSKVVIKNSLQWDTTNGYTNNGFSVTLKDSATTDTFEMVIPYGSSWYGQSIPKGTLFVTGIILQRDITSPYTSGYYIVPRMMSDISVTVGIEETVSQITNIAIYPNPVNDVVNIQLTNNGFFIGTVSIYSISGKLINQSKVSTENGKISISTNDLNQGVYILKLQDSKGGKISQLKLIKE